MGAIAQANSRMLADTKHTVAASNANFLTVAYVDSGKYRASRYCGYNYIPLTTAQKASAYMALALHISYSGIWRNTVRLIRSGVKFHFCITDSATTFSSASGVLGMTPDMSIDLGLLEAMYANTPSEYEYYFMMNGTLRDKIAGFSAGAYVWGFVEYYSPTESDINTWYVTQGALPQIGIFT